MHTPGWHVLERTTPVCTRTSVLLVVLRRVLLGVLLARVEAVRGAALHDLARPVGVLRRRVLDAVLEVEVGGVGTRAAVDDVLLAVADAEVVVAVLPAERVAGEVVPPVDVPPREREQGVVAGAAAGGVLAAVGEDPVVAGPAVLRTP
jgi:hypothetical protein